MKDVIRNLFSKIRVQKTFNFDKEMKKYLHNQECRYSNPCKIKTNGLRDLKLGLK